MQQRHTPQPLATGEPIITSYQQGRCVLEDERWTARPAQADALLEHLGPPGLETPQALLPGAWPLFGYTWDHEVKKGRYIIDEEAAAIVRRLFALAASGMSLTASAAC